MSMMIPIGSCRFTFAYASIIVLQLRQDVVQGQVTARSSESGLVLGNTLVWKCNAFQDPSLVVVQ